MSSEVLRMMYFTQKCSNASESQSNNEPSSYLSSLLKSPIQNLACVRAPLCLCVTSFQSENSFTQRDTYRYRKAEGYPRLSFRLSYTSEWKPRAECIQAHICTWCCSQRNGPGRWPWSQTEAPLGPRNETTQNLEREEKKDPHCVYFRKKTHYRKSNTPWGKTELMLFNVV